MKLPTLYGVDKNGRERMWKISSDGNTVHRESGLVDGKKVEWSREYEGKNIGKKNETSPEEQASRAAETMWTKQLTKGYVPRTKKGLEILERVKEASRDTGGHNINAAAAIRGRKKKAVKETSNYKVGDVAITVKPMKCDTWKVEDGVAKSTHSKYFKLGKEKVYVQPKFDGIRCVARLQPRGAPEDEESLENVEYDVVLTSNGLKEFPWFGKLREQIREFLRGKEDFILDGELYAHSLIANEEWVATDKKKRGYSPGEYLDDDARFSEISSMCGMIKSEPHPLDDQMQFHVFDIVDPTGKKKQSRRFKELRCLFETSPPVGDDEDASSPRTEYKNIKLAPTFEITEEDEIYEFSRKWVEDGYEGVIIRSDRCLYTSKRSKFIAKYKLFDDAEFEVVGVDKNTGVEDQFFVWRCVTENGDEFQATPMGTHAQKKKMLKNYRDYIGKQLTVKFQGWSDQGIPRFPIAKEFREEGV